MSHPALVRAPPMPRGITTETVGRAGVGLSLDLAVALSLADLGGKEAVALFVGAFLDFTPDFDGTGTAESFEYCLLQACAFPDHPT